MATSRKKLTLTVMAWALACLPALVHNALAAPTVALVPDNNPGLGTSHGLKKLQEALEAKGCAYQTINAPDHTQADLLIVAGLADGASLAAQIHETLNLNIPRDPEALLIQRVQWQGKPILLISGADDRGLMYALLDVAQRIEWALDPQTPLSQVHDIMETPAVVERALSKYTMHQTHFESYSSMNNTGPNS